MTGTKKRDIDAFTIYITLIKRRLQQKQTFAFTIRNLKTLHLFCSHPQNQRIFCTGRDKHVTHICIIVHAVSFTHWDRLIEF